MSFITYSGVLIEHANIKSDDIRIIDIAHHLTNINRFGGSLPFEKYYSVAEHSILLAQYVLETSDNTDAAKYALLHDASEAYLGDVVSGLKKHLHDYRCKEHNLMLQICTKYNVNRDYADYIDDLDKRIVLDEALALLPYHYNYFRNGLRPLGIENLAINDDDYGTYTPGTVPKDVVCVVFLIMCDRLGIDVHN